MTILITKLLKGNVNVVEKINIFFRKNQLKQKVNDYKKKKFSRCLCIFFLPNKFFII